MTTHLILLRHGQSTWNAEGRWQGQADPPLSPLGLDQAREAGRALVELARIRSETIERVVSSDLRRARTTADLIAGALGVGSAARLIEPALRERDIGPWSGLTSPEIEERFPGLLETGQKPREAEQDDALFERVTRGLCAIAERIGAARAVVVTHGGVIHQVEAKLGAPRPRGQRLTNLSGRVLRVRADGGLELGEQVPALAAGHSAGSPARDHTYNRQ